MYTSKYRYTYMCNLITHLRIHKHPKPWSFIIFASLIYFTVIAAKRRGRYCYILTTYSDLPNKNTSRRGTKKTLKASLDKLLSYTQLPEFWINDIFFYTRKRRVKQKYRFVWIRAPDRYTYEANRCLTSSSRDSTLHGVNLRKGPYKLCLSTIESGKMFRSIHLFILFCFKNIVQQS